jgi:hypothetical protein
MEFIAAMILYGIFYYVVTTFTNRISIKKIKKEVFSLYNQIFFLIGFILFFIFLKIEDHSTFAMIMKISMGILLIIDVLVYLFLKFNEYSFSWAIFSIILDIIAIPVGIIIVFIALGAGASTTYANCWWWCNDN